MPDITPTIPAVKPAIKTTEFALTIVANLFTIFLTFKGMLPSTTAAVVISTVTGVYIIARSIVKIYAPNEIIPDLPVAQ